MKLTANDKWALSASARRRYCDDVCRAQAYRARRVSDRIMALGMLLAEAE
ncbi:hypothetical protein [Streptomyces sp. NPDC004658]